MKRAMWLTVATLVLIGAGALAQVKPQMPPDVGTGAISLLLDPSGHPIGLYSRTRIPGA
jgi:hypothetical protein